MANFEQVVSDYYGKVAPPDTTVVSWLPFYHDMGLFLGVCAPILGGYRTVLMSPVSFLQRPARWMQLLASNCHALSAAPNFAFELAVRRTSDEDMAGLDLGDVACIISGSERIHAATLRRFTERFARFNLRDTVIRPSYGLAEATVYVATRTHRAIHQKSSTSNPRNCPPATLSGAEARAVHRWSATARRDHRPCGSSIPRPGPSVRRERSVRSGYTATTSPWATGINRKRLSKRSAEKLVAPSPGTPEEPWLRTGDLGFFSDGELFIIGRIKDLLIVYGRNHYPDDIEATIQEITGGRVAAISVPDDRTEKLVAIIELKKRGDSHEDAMHKLGLVKSEVTSAISNTHGLSVADLVLVPPGSIPITTSGKVRRSACVEHYRHNQFTRLDVPA